MTRRATIYGPEIIVFEEKNNCDAIVDVRSEYPVVKIYIGERIHIYKGLPYMIEVDKLSERADAEPHGPGPVPPSRIPGTKVRYG